MKKKLNRIGLIFLCLLCFSGCGNKSVSENPEIAEKESRKDISSKEVKVIQKSEEEDLTGGQDITKEQIPTELKPDSERLPAQDTQTMKKNILIALDPGHQSPNVDMSAHEPNAPGSDILKTKATGGTSGSFSGIPEYQLNLDIAWMVHDRLTAQGYDVIMTRENNDTAISNAERASLANNAGADISVRIHANGSENPDANGALILIGSAENPYVGGIYENSYRLGETVLDSYCSTTGMQNLGIQLNDSMTGINWSQIPVIILEMGFMTNQQDDLNMANSAYREKMADGIVSGINAYYGF